MVFLELVTRLGLEEEGAKCVHSCCRGSVWSAGEAPRHRGVQCTQHPAPFPRRWRVAEELGAEISVSDNVPQGTIITLTIATKCLELVHAA